ncbi:hypothetical protein PISMIDRAFT_15125 [Pisolithus microcarpus 441]|uniref:Unplaced genomic scaffold scaffold_145, whole genome shotgun sequence n=1 Tax=Pisolithus microcarpus 441 TaxID=765257 RepID=A0A0C9Y299_9AGAM|nr:hypothetical protein PISMIDRAFT_19648 [Pisolithus microcarpus 441]KIK17392.1 hypothetical protein PISMIDRAFT_15125 [Pisolithus microcarpus 441]
MTAPPLMSSGHTPDIHAIASLKQAISLLENENVQLHHKITKKPALSLTQEGRAVCQVVTLVKPVADLIAEYDCHEIQATEQQASSNAEVIPPTPEQQRTYHAYEKLIQWCPSVHKLVGPAADTDTTSLEVAFACKELQKGADGA